ncbi:MAG: PIN domain-containing protein [Chloroflexi bacterium]|nr:PIN domain-containing protein [Chloroflexota bacterium]
MSIRDRDRWVSALRTPAQWRAASSRLLLEIPTAERTASVLARLEVEGGMRSDERRPVASLFGVLRLLPVTDQVARRAGEYLRMYRRSHGGIDLVDYVIAATAELHGARLATLHIKHFPMFPDLAPPY